MCSDDTCTPGSRASISDKDKSPPSPDPQPGDGFAYIPDWILRRLGGQPGIVWEVGTGICRLTHGGRRAYATSVTEFARNLGRSRKRTGHALSILHALGIQKHLPSKGGNDRGGVVLEIPTPDGKGVSHREPPDEKGTSHPMGKERPIGMGRERPIGTPEVVANKSARGRGTESGISKTAEESESCPEPPTDGRSGPPSADSTTLLAFPIIGSQERWELTQEQVDTWQSVYVGVDVLQECRKAWAWIDANPTRRKTASGMKKFLTGWLGRAQDRAPAHRSPDRGPVEPKGMAALRRSLAKKLREEGGPVITGNPTAGEPRGLRPISQFLDGLDETRSHPLWPSWEMAGRTVEELGAYIERRRTSGWRVSESGEIPGAGDADDPYTERELARLGRPTDTESIAAYVRAWFEQKAKVVEFPRRASAQ